MRCSIASLTTLIAAVGPVHLASSEPFGLRGTPAAAQLVVSCIGTIGLPGAQGLVATAGYGEDAPGGSGGHRQEQRQGGGDHHPQQLAVILSDGTQDFMSEAVFCLLQCVSIHVCGDSRPRAAFGNSNIVSSVQNSLCLQYFLYCL